MKHKTGFFSANVLWDAWCVASIIGIWPRFIEPNLLSITKQIIPIPNLSEELHGLRVVQISDLHYSFYTNPHFLQRIIAHIEKLSPHVIVFTGDLVTYAHIPKDPELFSFLKALVAPLGTYAICGNHDYAAYISNDAKGELYTSPPQTTISITQGLRKLLSKEDKNNKTPLKNAVDLNSDLMDLYAKADITCLHNETIQIGKKRHLLNITGLGEYMALQCDPLSAFKKYHPLFPGIVLCHNPDAYPLLEGYPGDLLLFGHTHGGQVNLPFLSKRICLIKDTSLKKGLHKRSDKFLYVNRGLGSVFPFRWFSIPEITLFTLIRHGPIKQQVDLKQESYSLIPESNPLQQPVSNKEQ